MSTDSLKLVNVGPIKSAEIEFGDLTVLVGPQATGKSIFLQFLKLVLDKYVVSRTFDTYGFNWRYHWDAFCDLYFGEGMRLIWHAQSKLTWNGRDIDDRRFVYTPRRVIAEEKCFFIPAHRVLALSRDGWLRPFADYKPGDPYVIRDFSEKLRVLVEAGLGRDAAVFPQRRLNSEVRRLFASAVFSGFSLKVDRQGPQKRLVLAHSIEPETGLPFMVWSAGQREFVPLLLGLYWLTPAEKEKRRAKIKWVVVEELEMGLHPKAISAMLLAVLDLLSRGYRVCLSTHSPHVLDLVWALRMFRDHEAHPNRVLDLFGVKHTPAMSKVAASALKAETKVYYFDPETRTARDISKLDPGSDLAEEAGWGGLTEFSGRVADEVARVVADQR